MTPDTPVRNPNIVSRKEEKEALLFNPSDGNILCINRTGIFIWDRCDGASSVKDIVGEITRDYEVTAEKAEKDCIAYLGDLEKSGFIGYKSK